MSTNKVMMAVHHFILTCACGYTEVVKHMIQDQRVDVNKPDKDNRTPIWTASNNNRTQVVQAILQSGRYIDLEAVCMWLQPNTSRPGYSSIRKIYQPRHKISKQNTTRTSKTKKDIKKLLIWSKITWQTLLTQENQNLSHKVKKKKKKNTVDRKKYPDSFPIVGPINPSSVADELVVFSANQVLPLFAIYVWRKKRSLPSKTNNK